MFTQDGDDHPSPHGDDYQLHSETAQQQQQLRQQQLGRRRRRVPSNWTEEGIVEEELEGSFDEAEEEHGGGGSSAFAEAALHSRGMATLTSSTASVESNWQYDSINNNNNNKKILEGSSSTASLESIWNSSRVGLHRRRTLYLIRHGEAIHNVLEAEAQSRARREAEAMDLTPEQSWERMEEARRAVLEDASLRDAPLTDLGRQQAREAARKLQGIIDKGVLHAPTEAMCSPLSRCLETCQILLENAQVRAHIRMELTERKTQYPPDTAKPLDELLRCTSNDDRFVVNHIEQLSAERVEAEAAVRESKEMLRQRAGQMFDLLMEMQHRHVLVVSHKGFLRELERGLLELPDSPLFGNCELRVYRVIFTMGDRQLYHLERLY
jgi:broad specificity phosphatase PhoE